MARLESIRLTGHRAGVIDGRVVWEATRSPAIEGMPQICWENGQPWREANLWFFERACTREVALRTVVANATALHAYAQWLEATSTSWWDFPPRKADRCLVRFRGSLVKARDDGELAPSTATARMRAVVTFYRWLKASGLLSPEWPMWRERTVGVHLTDGVGFDRTIMVNSTDLAIPNRARHGERLEDGVLPLSSAERDTLLKLAKEHASEELHLMLALGFYTGMRLGTICDLKIQTLLDAAVDSESSALYRVAIGPGASPPVATKFGVTGRVWVLAALMKALREYAFSVRRLKRESLAEPANRNLVFLTRYGNPYALRGADKSASVNVEMHRFKAIARQEGFPMKEFRFHQTRATFGTELARHFLRKGSVANAIAMVRDLMLHKHEATTLKYIRFAEKSPVKEDAANAFTKDFLGVMAEKTDSSNA